MENRGMFKRAMAAALLSATLATPVTALLATGTANARPIESPNCDRYLHSFESSMSAARVARAQGDDRAYRDWMSLAGQAKANYNRHCLG
ncbi:hypothetical protein [Mycolicibacterium gadium]|uniref:Secreted protein n=1 Tax=Mycolicibacterium gadium TaxID=1794 RepID=A0A7I7WJI0_MYCGU|nr:hypothetical protein [Mycolicibacterium gadium]BBZ17300.1 hypothetical protein MGAD_16350 [Mycolicibacterium gadium]